MLERKLCKQVLDPTFMITKTLHQKNTIPNSAGTKELKSDEYVKQCRDNFQFGGKDKLPLKLMVFFTSPKSLPVFSEIWKYYIQGLNLGSQPRVCLIFRLTVRCLRLSGMNDTSPNYRKRAMFFYLL